MLGWWQLEPTSCTWLIQPSRFSRRHVHLNPGKHSSFDLRSADWPGSSPRRPSPAPPAGAWFCGFLGREPHHVTRVSHKGRTQKARHSYSWQNQKVRPSGERTFQGRTPCSLDSCVRAAAAQQPFSPSSRALPHSATDLAQRSRPPAYPHHLSGAKGSIGNKVEVGGLALGPPCRGSMRLGSILVGPSVVR